MFLHPLRKDKLEARLTVACLKSVLFREKDRSILGSGISETPCAYDICCGFARLNLPAGWRVWGTTFAIAWPDSKKSLM